MLVNEPSRCKLDSVLFALLVLTCCALFDKYSERRNNVHRSYADTKQTWRRFCACSSFRFRLQSPFAREKSVFEKNGLLLVIISSLSSSLFFLASYSISITFEYS